MKCPYNRKSERHVQKWGQSLNEDNIPSSGVQTDEYTFELMECEKENCGVWHNGKCCYASVSFENQ